jgi:glucose/arabinose dehydrogenase
MTSGENELHTMLLRRFLRSWPLLVGAAMLTMVLACRSPRGPISETSPVEGTTQGTSTPLIKDATPTVSHVSSPATPSPVRSTPTTTSAWQNVAIRATVSASSGEDSARKAVDGNPESLWSAGKPAPQSFTVTLDRPYLVNSVQLVVAQTPPGQTTHEIWLGDESGTLTRYKKLVNTWTSDGETLTVPIDPPRVVTSVVVRTDESPSFVAWREVRVLGQPPSAGALAAAKETPRPGAVVNWPKITVVGSFDMPVQVTNAGDGSGRIFVAERRGRIRIVKDGVPLERPFLDISDRVKCCASEQGFFDVAFPPDFEQNQHFYVSYTALPRDGKFGPVGDTVIARFRVSSNPDVADPNSEQIILTLHEPADAHNGGHLAFGPNDGYLYIGSGDGGLENDPTNEAQNPDSLLGKILRIDVESGATPYAIPPDNPFVDKAGYRPEIWAMGLRNPWQFSFDQETGDLYIADVGENTYEEVDFQPASSHGGENYGWHIMEGTRCYLSTTCNSRGLTLPVAEYSHKQGCAIIGGTVYRGKQYPDMQGIYFYGDLCTGRIWGLQRAGGVWESNLLAKEPFQITDIGEDEQGNLYLTDFTDGTIFKIAEPLPETG